MTFITQASLQVLATILGPQNRIQGRCEVLLPSLWPLGTMAPLCGTYIPLIILVIPGQSIGAMAERQISRDGKFLYQFQECLDPGLKSNNLMDRFLYFLHFDPVLLISCKVLSTFHEIFVCK